MDTPIKPVVALGFPRFFGVADEEEEGEGLDCRTFLFLVAGFVVALFVVFKDKEKEVEDEEDEKDEEDEEDEEDENTCCCGPVLFG